MWGTLFSIILLHLSADVEAERKFFSMLHPVIGLNVTTLVYPPELILFI